MIKYLAILSILIISCDSKATEVESRKPVADTTKAYRPIANINHGGVTAYTNSELGEICRSGIIDVCMRLGEFYEKESLVGIANIFYKTACLLGNTIGCMKADLSKQEKLQELPEMLYHDICNPDPLPGCPNFPKPSKEYLAEEQTHKEKCDKKKNSLSCNIYSSHLFKIDKKEQAIPYMEKSCEYGDLKSCHTVGIIYYMQGKVSEAIKMQNRLCYTENIPTTCYDLGMLLIEIEDGNKAKEAFTKACEYNFENSCEYVNRLNKSKF